MAGKIAKNRARDAATGEKLRGLGWRALVVWECELKDREALERKLRAFVGERG